MKNIEAVSHPAVVLIAPLDIVKNVQKEMINATSATNVLTEERMLSIEYAT